MNKLVFFGALTGALVTLHTAAMAQYYPGLRRNETWCIESREGGRGGGGSILCRFETYGQCMASRAGPGDRCLMNPALGDDEPPARRPRRNY